LERHGLHPREAALDEPLRTLFLFAEHDQKAHVLSSDMLKSTSRKYIEPLESIR
jgi:hypothetical protein